MAGATNNCTGNTVFDPNTQTCVCMKGYYGDGTNCTKCSHGTTTEGPGATSSNECKCEPGMYMSDAGNVCQACPPGTFMDVYNDSFDCYLCPQGTYADSTGSVSCTPCNEGLTTASSGATSSTQCNICAQGWYGGEHGCHPCPNGTSTSGIGKLTVSQCDVCAPGYYGNGIRCNKCPKDTYKDTHATATACTACPSKSETIGTGATALSDCKCDIGYYMASGTDKCVRCSSKKLHSTTLSTGATSQDECLCEAGYYNYFLGNECIGCPSGMYKDVISNDGQCTRCEGGKYAPTTGLANCYDCPIGHCCTDGNIYKCKKGTYSDSTNTQCSRGDVGKCELCGRGCTTIGIGSTSAASCSVKTADKFCLKSGTRGGGYDNEKCFSWPTDAVIYESPLSSNVTGGAECPPSQN